MHRQRDGKKASIRKYCLDINLSVKSDDAPEMSCANFGGEKNNEIDYLLVLRRENGWENGKVDATRG